MAYQPVSKPKTGVGYVPVSKRVDKTTEVFNAAFPVKNRLLDTAVSNVKKTPPKPPLGALAKEFIVPSRGYTDTQIAEAKPTVKDYAVGGAKAVGEIGAGLAGLVHMGGSAIADVILPGYDKELSTKAREEAQKVVEPYITPGTAGEAQAMRVADIAGFVVGWTKAGKLDKIKKAIINVDNVDDARKILRSSELPEDIIIKLKLDEKAVAVKTAKEADDFVKEVVKNTTPLPKITPKQNTTKPPKASVSIAKQKIAPTTRPVDDSINTASKIISKTDDETVIRNTITEEVPVLKDSPELEALVKVLKSKKSATEAAEILRPLVDRTIQTLPKKFSPSNPPIPQADETVVYFEKTGGDTQYVATTIDEIQNQLGTLDNVEVGVVKNNEITYSKFDEKANAGIGTISQNVAQRVVLDNRVIPTKLPTLPKLTPDVVKALETGQADKTIKDGIRTRYQNASRKPVREDSKLAAEAKKPGNIEGFKKIAGELLTPISSRLERINPKLKTALRKFEFAVAAQTTKDSNAVLPLLKATKKMSAEDRALFDLAQKNADTEVINALAKRYSIEKELNQTRKILNDINKRANEVGMDIGYVKDYFPRVVINPNKYMAFLRGRDDWGYIQRLIEEAATKKGLKYTDLTEEEKVSIVNNFIRGYGDKTVLAKSGFSQARTIQVIDDKLNEFYENSDSALSAYVIRMNDEIEARKFFGKKADGDARIQDSIGQYVLDLVVKKEIKPDQEKEVADILRSRFHRGKMNGALDVYRNMEYLSTMGSPISAITQIGDLAFSVYANGFYNSLKGAGKSLFSKNKLSKEALGIENITQEFTKNTVSGKFLDGVFKAVGLNKLDRLGKETLVNGYLAKLQRQARRKDDVLLTELDKYFDPEEAQQVLKELSNGEITEGTKFLAFNKLLDFQPVAKSEMPQKYLEMPNGRLFYMLKSFTLKQYDVFRREAIDDIASGNPAKVAKGMKNLVKIAGLFIAANATADEIKDLVLGRETDPSDKVVDNLWRLVGATKYDVYKAREEGFGKTLVGKLLFPTSVFDRLTKDVNTVVEDKKYERGPLKGEQYKFESTQTIPVGGKLYYWWFGRGAQKEQAKQETTGTSTLPALPKLPKIGGTLPTLPQI